jgi:DNA-binding MarR family transcriptional regulator
MNQRDELLERLEHLQPLLRTRLEDHELQSEFVSAFGGITVHQLSVLCVLVEAGPLTMNQLAARMDIVPSAVTQLVDRLAQHGLVERSHDAADRRVQRVVVTVSASEAVKRFKTARKDRLTALLGPLTDDELRIFVGLIERMLSDGAPACGEGER